MEHGAVGDGASRHGHAGDDTAASDGAAAVDPAVFNIGARAHGGPGAYIAVADGVILGRETAVHRPLPAQEPVLLHAVGHKVQQLPGGAEVDKGGGGQADKLHFIRMQHIPEGSAALPQLRRKISLRLFFIELLQGRAGCHGIQKIRVEGQPRPVVYIGPVAFRGIDEAVQAA